MRSTLLASCLLGLSFTVVGCDDAKKVDDTAAPVVSTPAEPGKGGMEGTTAPAVTPAPTEPGKDAMEGPAAAPVAPTTPEVTPTPATPDAPKTEEMPK